MQAIAKRNPPAGLVHHSDRGIQYACAEYVAVLARHGTVSSMSRAGCPYDNAMCESWMKTLQQEEIYANDYRDQEDLTAHLEEFIERYYNRPRLHSAPGYRSPEQFEAETASEPAAALSFWWHGRSIDPLGKGSRSGPVRR